MLLHCNKLAANAHVAVVGAGVGGLTFAYFLSKLRSDVKITIIDAAERTGGWINSAVLDRGIDNTAVVLEKGPRTLRGKSEGTTLIVDTLRTLNHSDSVYYIEPDSDANRKFLLDTSDLLVQVPNSLSSLRRFLASSLGKGLLGGLLGEPFRKRNLITTEDESAHSLITRRFGSTTVSDNIFSAIFHGIYAGDIKQLSAKRTLAAIYKWEQDYGSIIKGALKSSPGGKGRPILPQSLLKYQKLFGRDPQELSDLYSNLRKLPLLGLRKGLETFPRALSAALLENPKVHFLMGNGVSQIEAEQEGKMCISLTDGRVIKGLDHIRLTNTPQAISQIIGYSNLQKCLQRVKSNTVVLLNFYHPNKDLISKHHSFGYLVPQSNKNREQLLGVIFDSVIENNFKPLLGDKPYQKQSGRKLTYTKLTAMVGGHYLNHGQEKKIQDSSYYTEQVKKALMRHLSIPEAELECGEWQVTFARDCLPQFFVGYDKWMAQTSADLAKKYEGAISLGGMAFSKGPGVPDVVMDGFEDAQSLALTH
ncbi:LADA_0B05490g1_1 [Lachancea dasiensis]|uniref:Protoporphyrinogen oxidase n=1 Tax=Lachancea dasiensis TaxID=1072105 RepID=A0A1G4IT87_9SACH|nr:LADA_0B05490g1_1 [Lachancea dasiensis]